MSEYNFCVCHDDVDYEVVCDIDFGSDVKHGDFELEITGVYLDVDVHTNLQGKNLFDDMDQDVIDSMSETICENEDLAMLSYEEACSRGEWLRDQRKDSQLMGDE